MLIPDWANALREAHPQSGNCHGSSPIGKLSSERFIPDLATASLFIFRGGKPPLENHRTNTCLWDPKAHPQLGNCPRKARPLLSNCLLSSATEGPRTWNLILVRSEKRNPHSRIIAPYWPPSSHHSATDLTSLGDHASRPSTLHD